MIRKHPGVSLVELLLYMALSGLVVVSMATFLMNMFQARVVTAAQTTVQDSTRVMLERMTIAIRHGYKVETPPNKLIVYSHPPSDPTDTVYTVFVHMGNQLLTGSGDDLSAIVARPMHAPEIAVDTFTVTRVSSAVEVQLSATSGKRSSLLESTIAYRQL